MAIAMRVTGALLTAALAGTMPVRGAEPADPGTGGAGGEKAAILFLSWKPRLDKTYAQDLSDSGYVFASANSREALDPDFLHRFNVFVLDEYMARTDGRDPAAVNYRFNMANVKACVTNGAGLLWFACHYVQGWNEEMRPWGARVEDVGVVDWSTAFGGWSSYASNSLCWTENLGRHAVTKGLRRFYYPSGELSGTYNYITRPLHCDKAWTPLVETSSRSFLGTTHPPHDKRWWIESEPGRFVIAAARPVGQGRVAVISINSDYFHREGYGGGSTVYEQHLGALDGTVLKAGNGEVPSDTWALMVRLYAWLAGASAAQGFGGYVQGDPVPPADPPPTAPEPGPALRLRALIGAHSAYSDGSGTVAEYARAAQAHGYALLVFTERFDAFERQRWDAFVADCEQQTTEDFVCLPGFEMRDPDNNAFLLVAPPYYPHRAWLDPDGKRLANPYLPNIAYDRHMVIAHRPDSCPLPVERLKHFQGLSVYTYRGDQLIDNSLSAFTWELKSASFPVPIVVHELFGPGEIAVAAATGFQQYMPEVDTVTGAVEAFCRIGMWTVPQPMIGEGPIIERLGVVGDYDPRVQGPDPLRPKWEQSFRMELVVSNDVPIRHATLYDGYEPLRRWAPTGRVVQLAADLPFSHQYAPYAIVEDVKGRRALRSDLWISPGGLKPRAGRFPGLFRCTDRQNWLGHVPMYYTGAGLPLSDPYYGMRIAVRGTEEGSGVFTSLPGSCMAAKWQVPFLDNHVVVTDYILDEKYVDSTFHDVGLAALPSRASKPTSVYAGRLRHMSFTQGLENEPWVALLEYELTLKRGVEPRDPAGLFPALERTRGTALCAWDGEGAFLTGRVDRAGHGQVVPVPRGSLGGGVIPLDDGFAVADGRIGRVLPGAPDYLPAGTRLTGRFLVPGKSNQVGSYDHVTRSFEEAPEAWLRAMGFAGDTPYRIEMSRGTLGPIAFVAPMIPQEHGVAGRVTRAAEIPYQVPMRITGLNRRWTAGSWREGEDIVYAGVFDDTAWPRLDVGKQGRFYAGHFLMADRLELVLAMSAWNAAAIAFEAHNPTAAAIEARVWTPPEVQGYKPFERTILVPPGQSLYIDG